MHFYCYALFHILVIERELEWFTYLLVLEIRTTHICSTGNMQFMHGPSHRYI